MNIAEIRNKFLETFRDLIEECKEFICLRDI